MNDSVKEWIGEFENDPVPTIQKLILGYSGVVAWSGTSLRECIIEIYHYVPELLDQALSDWFEERIMKPPPEQTPDFLWAHSLEDLFCAIHGLRLPKTSKQLARREDIESWLGSMTSDDTNPKFTYSLHLVTQVE
jgi:hypothetical protein